jgi:hypothetical protein
MKPFPLALVPFSSKLQGEGFYASWHQEVGKDRVDGASIISLSQLYAKRWGELEEEYIFQC